MGSEPNRLPEALSDEVDRLRSEFESSWRAGRWLSVEQMLAGRSGPSVETLRHELTATAERLHRESTPGSGSSTRPAWPGAGGGEATSR